MADATIETESTVRTFGSADDADDAEAALVEEELLVEEISIDGMCGVY